MAESEHLKDLKVIWRDSCHSMWAELLSISMAESYVISNYKDVPKRHYPRCFMRQTYREGSTI